MSDFSRSFGSGFANSPGIRTLFGNALNAGIVREKAYQDAAVKGAHAGLYGAKADSENFALGLKRDLKAQYDKGGLTPEERLNAIALLFAGDSNANQIAQAQRINLGTAWAKNMAENPGVYDIPLTSKIMAAVEGKPMYGNANFAGGTTDLYGGDQKIANLEAFGSYINEVKSRVAENRAQAGNASASAARTRQAMGNEKLNIKAIDTPDGQQLVNVNRDGTYTPITNRETGQVAVPGYRPQSGRGNRRPGSSRPQSSQQPAMSQQDFDAFANDVRAKLARGDITREQARNFLMQARGGQ